MWNKLNQANPLTVFKSAIKLQGSHRHPKKLIAINNAINE